jgi:hypothetical protein|tara:strand:- start:35 stop:346 length:312 start_codon:yes stop_codon:yes gene_type:complete
MAGLDKMKINKKGQPLTKTFRGGGIAKRGLGAAFRGGGIAKRGSGVALAKGGRTGKFGGGRTNLLEEVGRIDAERMNPNRRAEKARVIGELNRGYKHGKSVKK